MRMLNLREELEKLGLSTFSVNDIAKITGNNTQTVKVFLHRQVQQGHLQRVKKNHYSIHALDTFQKAATYKNTYIGINSALEYYGTTTQQYIHLNLIGTTQRRSNQEIQHHTITKKMFFGYEKTQYNGVWFFISNKEKTIIDCTYFSHIVYLSEIREFIRQTKTELDIKRLTEYLNRINSSTLNKRVGYLLEQEGIHLTNITINNKYEKLNKNLEKKGEKNTTWKLIINEEV